MVSRDSIPTPRSEIVSESSPGAALRLEIRTLGSLSLRLGEQVLPPFHSRKAEALLVYLACTRQPHSREVLADMFWDGHSQTRAAANLRTLLSSMRQTLAPYLGITRYAVSFNAQSDYWLDAQAFEQLSQSDDPPNIAQLEAALALYRGQFLQGFFIRESPRFEEWMLMQQERLERKVIVALRQLGEHSFAQRQIARGIEWVSRLLQIDSLDEQAHQQMMKLLALSGPQAAALSHYESMQRLFAAQLGVAPNAETTALHEQIRSGRWRLEAGDTKPAMAHEQAPLAYVPLASAGDAQPDAGRPQAAFVGRELQLAALGDLFAQAAKGHGRLALMVGEAGIGKSRLAAEFKAAQPGALTLQGRCFEDDRALPYAPLIDLLSGFCAGRPVDELRRAFGATASELVKIFPDLSTFLPGAAPSSSLEPEQEKRRVFQALVQWMHRLGQQFRVPLLVILEDLHWCDDTSLAWLRYFVREIERQRVLVLLTYRDAELPTALNELLATLDRMPFMSELRLAQLTRLQVDDLLRTSLNLSSPSRLELRDALHALTDGNPLFLEEVLKSLIAAGDLYQVGGEWTRKPLSELRIPRSVQVAVQQRTRGLSAAAHYLLTLAAVAGQRFDFPVLQAATGSADSELIAPIKELLAAQLVIEQSDETFAFRHALTRQAIEAGLLGRERKALHRTVAEALLQCYAETRDAHAGELAHQYEAAELWAPALHWSQRAGEQAEQLYAYGEALSHYSRARACAERLGLVEQITALDQIIGRVYYARNEIPRALASYERALHTTTDPARRAALKAEIGIAYASTADERGLAWLREALDELDPTAQPATVATATLWLGRHYAYRGQYAQALPYLERARQLNEPLADTTTLRFVYGFLADAMLMSGQFEQSMLWARRCIALGETKQYLPAIIVGYYDLSTNAEYLGRWPEAREFAEQGRQRVPDAGWLNEKIWIELRLARVVFYQGQLAAGVELARAGLALASESGGLRSIARAHETLALFEIALGQEGPASLSAEAAVRAADTLSDINARCRARLALAALCAQRAEWARAAELVEQCRALLAGSENRVLPMELGARMAEVYGAQGRLAEAVSLIEATLQETHATGARHLEAVAWRVQAQLWAAQGRNADAVRAFAQAIAISEALGSQLELAHAHFQRGTFHRGQHDVAAARADWTRTRSLCEQMGALALLWQTRAALGQLALAQADAAGATQEFGAARAIVAALTARMRDTSFQASLASRAAALIPSDA